MASEKINHPHLPLSPEQRIEGLEDEISTLKEIMAILVAIARRDHPELVASWPEEEES